MTTGCSGNAGNCKLLTTLADHHRQRCQKSGITKPAAVLDAMAVGLVEEVWRSGPVEAMHGSKHGPTDTTMFAESTDLHVHAVNALTVPDRAIGLLDFEQQLLDRERSWACSGGRTLRQVGYGYLGAYTRHVRERTGTLIGLEYHTCIDNPFEIYLVHCALRTGQDRKGMPNWKLVVERIGVLLDHPGHRAWSDTARGVQARAAMPASVGTVDDLQTALLKHPPGLPCEVLDWLSEFFLYTAGPPYRRVGWNHPG